MCKRPNYFGVFLDMDLTHSTLGLQYALRSLRFDPSLSLVKLYKEPLGTLKAYREIESKETIVHCCQNLYLILHPFVPFGALLCSSQACLLLVSLLSRDGGLRWWRPKWGIQFLQFADVLTEVVSIVISDLY